MKSTAARYNKPRRGLEPMQNVTPQRLSIAAKPSPFVLSRASWVVAAAHTAVIAAKLRGHLRGDAIIEHSRHTIVRQYLQQTGSGRKFQGCPVSWRDRQSEQNKAGNSERRRSRVSPRVGDTELHGRNQRHRSTTRRRPTIESTDVENCEPHAAKQSQG